MAKKRDLPKLSSDRKPTTGNIVWSLVAAGVASLFALSLVSVAELEVTYSDLERLIAASTREGDERFVELSAAAGESGQGHRYGDLHDVVIGAFQVHGKVREACGLAMPPSPRRGRSPHRLRPSGGFEWRSCPARTPSRN